MLFLFSVSDEIDESFEMSFRREIDALRRFRDQSADDFVMTMRHVADPSWGINRGRPPRHPRYVIVEAERQSASVKVDEHGDKVENGQEEGTKSLGSMGRWLNALTRVGDGVLRDLSHEVSYRRIASCGDVKLGLNSERNVDDMIVVTEMINADWTSLSKVQGLSEALKERANEVVVTLGAARKMVVLQSDVEPSFFKTVEYYNNDEGLIAHMKATDSAFSENIKAYKAAVNRVRQAFKILKT